MPSSGRVAPAGPLIKRLELVANNREQRYWASMARAEFMIANGQGRAASEMLKASLNQEPQSFVGMKLLANAFHSLGDKDNAESTEMRLDNLGVKMSWAASREGISSPVGPLALSNRPPF